MNNSIPRIPPFSKSADELIDHVATKFCCRDEAHTFAGDLLRSGFIELAGCVVAWSLRVRASADFYPLILRWKDGYWCCLAVKTNGLKPDVTARFFLELPVNDSIVKWAYRHAISGMNDRTLQADRDWRAIGDSLLGAQTERGNVA